MRLGESICLLGDGLLLGCDILSFCNEVPIQQDPTIITYVSQECGTMSYSTSRERDKDSSYMFSRQKSIMLRVSYYETLYHEP